MNKPPSVNSLSELLIYELAKAMTIQHIETAKRLFRRLFGSAAHKFSALALELDRIVGEGGLSAGARWVQPRFVRSNNACGVENIPTEGPLLIASNHPGSFDSVMISAHVDPSLSSHADGEFNLWSRSLEIFLRHVPQAHILTTIVSGVIAGADFRHPITWLRRKRPDKQRLAFMYQMIRQMASGTETFGLRARVTFGEITRGSSQQHNLDEHIAWQV